MHNIKNIIQDDDYLKALIEMSERAANDMDWANADGSHECAYYLIAKAILKFKSL
jgi:hypothetical protein